MTRYKSIALGALLGIVLSLAPLTSAFAQYRHYGGHVFWPIAALAGAVVGTAAAIVTAPIAIGRSTARSLLRTGSSLRRAGCRF